MSFEPDSPRHRVVIDTNALYSMPLADTLLRAADRGLFDFVWTADIMRELQETMLRQGFPANAAARRVTAMQRAFRDTQVRGYEDLIPRLRLPDADDRHVLAAAIHAEAWAVVTANVKDFPRAILAEHAIRAITPADLLAGIIQEFPQHLLEIVREQAAALRQPPMTFELLVDKVAEYAPEFGAILRSLDARDRQASVRPAAPDAQSSDPLAGDRRDQQQG